MVWEPCFRVGKSVVLTAGWETPRKCQHRQSGGVAIYFCTGHAVANCSEDRR